MGGYPLFACEDWSALKADLDEIDGELVCLSLVTDPFGAFDEGLLQRCFVDVVLPFKRHFVVDLTRPAATFVSAHHRRYAQRALREVAVERCADPASVRADWIALYADLVQRRGIHGLATFSPTSLGRQLEVPGTVVFRALRGGVTVGAVVWYLQGDVAYYHLGAYSDRGYDLRASFALFWHAIEELRGTVRWLSLGAGAGMQGDGSDGLMRFKRGWSTGTQPAYFCGRILDRARYARIVAARQAPATAYFPAYRHGEFR